MKFFKRFLLNFCYLLFLCIAMLITAVVFIAPLFLAINNRWWLLAYPAYFIFILSYYITVQDMKDGER